MRTLWEGSLGKITDWCCRHQPALLNLVGEQGEVLRHGLDAAGHRCRHVEVGKGGSGEDGGAERRHEERGEMHLHDRGSIVV